MATATTVNVKQISSQTGEKEVRDFFSFCGKISSLSVSTETDGSQSAAVTFEKPTAAKTALLLDNTQLGPSLVQVSSAATLEELSADKSGPGVETAQEGDSEVSQEDKPRSRIVAEYLAQGYTISDKAIERAIALDNQHGLSTRFTSALQSFDQRTGATDRAVKVDQQYGLTEKAMQGWHGLNTYFEKALGTQSGQKVRDFYMQSSKQVVDVHAEARRLADYKSSKGVEAETAPVTGAVDATQAEKMGMEKVEGTEKTKCNCGGDTGVCPCEPGKCACSGCAKASA